MGEEFLKKFYRKKTIDKIQTKINLLGVSTKWTAVKYITIKVLTSLILFFLVLTSFNYGYIFAVILTTIYYYMSDKLLLDSEIKKRASRLDSEAIYFFEVLTLSLETGRNLAEAVSVTVNGVDSELSREFKEALRQTKFGKSLTESLGDMEKNIPSENINNIILTLTEANMYGSSIIETMYNQVDYLREKRKMEVKAKISKLPTKISIISVFFFIPLILLIILGPALISFIG